MAEVVATFEVFAGHTIVVQMDDVTDPAKVAAALYEADPGISLCHQCSDDIDDPEPGELVCFTVNGVTWERGTWSSGDGESR